MGSKLKLNVGRNIASKAKEIEEFAITPRVRSLRGSVKVPDDFDYKKILAEEIIRK